MKAKGYAGDVIEMEVTNSREVDAAAARVMAEKGRADILVCNAGIARSERPAEDVPMRAGQNQSADVRCLDRRHADGAHGRAG